MSHWATTKPPLGTILDRGHPLAQGLIGGWLLNEGSGGYLNDICGLNPGVFVGGAWGGGVQLSGSSGYTLSPASATLNNPTQFSVFVLATIASTMQSFGMIATVYSGSDATTKFQIHRNAANNNINYRIGNGSGNDSIVGTVNVFDGKPHSIGLSVGPKINTYVDAIADGATTTTTAAQTVAAPFQLGARGTNGLLMTGNIAMALYYSRALTQPDFIQLHAEPYCMIAPPAGRNAYFLFGGTIFRRSLTNRAGSRTAA